MKVGTTQSQESYERQPRRSEEEVGVRMKARGWSDVRKEGAMSQGKEAASRSSERQ